MALDAGFVRKLERELQTAVDCHIDKLYQPSSDELVFLLRKKGFAKRLYITARQGQARVQFSETRPENPETPPNFCMVARKHFSGAKLVSVKQYEFERLIELTFETTDELGDRVQNRIICELIGNKSNIILVGKDGKIIDAVRRSDISEEGRIIHSGAVYRYPDLQDKLSPCDTDADTIVKDVKNYPDMMLSSALLKVIGGTSPLICREIAYRTFGNDISVGDADEDMLKKGIGDMLCEYLSQGKPTMLLLKDGTPFDFSYTDIFQYGDTYDKKYFEDYAQLLDAFYLERDNAARIKRMSLDINKLVNNLLSRANKRMQIRKAELEKSRNRDDLRIKGELIKANIHLIKTGDSVAKVPDFYDENLREVSIPLDVSLSPAMNAAKYFKEYKKCCAAAGCLGELIEKDEKETEYLNSVLESLERCESAADIAQIKSELENEGYVKQKARKRSNKESKININYLQSVEGYKIAVGKNNIQNDYITTRLASKNDLWFHTKAVHGSHVVVFCNGNPVSDETVMFAARLAAKNSKAKNSTNVAVDYTPIKYVKKPSGARTGMVIYTTNKTVYVRFDDNI